MAVTGPLAPGQNQEKQKRPPAPPPAAVQSMAQGVAKVEKRALTSESPEKEVSTIRRILSAAWKTISAPFPTIDVQKILQNFRGPSHKITKNDADNVDTTSDNFKSLPFKKRVSILVAKGEKLDSLSPFFTNKVSAEFLPYTVITDKADAEHFRKCIKALPTPLDRILYIEKYVVSEDAHNIYLLLRDDKKLANLHRQAVVRAILFFQK